MMTSNRSQLIELIQQGAIAPEQIESALKASKVRPDNQAWATYLDRLLLCFGAMALSLAVLFFFAYNWADLGKYAKFGLAELAIVLAVAVYYFQGHKPLVAKVSLLAASILLGVLLALYGQTYQTGADPWQLFFNWALLMLPWALISRFAPTWILWIALLNLSIQLYDGPMRSVLRQVFASQEETLWLLFALNALALIIWELLANRLTWMSARWVPRLLAVAAGAPMTWLAVNSILGRHQAIAAMAWCAGAMIVAFIYQRLIRDLFMLAGLCLSGIVVTISFFLRNVFRSDFADGFLVLAVLIIALGGGSAMWLKRVHQRWQS